MLYDGTLLTARLVLEDRYAKSAREWLLADAIGTRPVRSGMRVATGAFLVRVGAHLTGVRYEPVSPLTGASSHR